MHKKIAALALVLACCAQAVPSFAADAAANFKKICVACHGADRKGKPAMAKLYKVAPAAMDLTVKDVLSKSDADLAAIIADGKGKMPPNKGKLTTEEIAALAAYLKTAKEEIKTAGQPAPAAANADYKACVSCHGKDGKGNPGMARMFKVAPPALDLTGAGVQEKKDEDLAKIILEGKGKMPAYKAKLNEAQLKELIKYLRALAPKK